jgi:hypothetical protein
VIRTCFTRLTAAAVAAAALAFTAAPSMAQQSADAGATAAKSARPERSEHRGMRYHQAIARLKEKLKLTAEQESAWNTFSQSMEPAKRAPGERKDPATLTTPERVDQMHALRAKAAEAADRRGDAIKAFYAVLTPAQQKVFDDETLRMYRHGPGPGKMREHKKGPRHADKGA